MLNTILGSKDRMSQAFVEGTRVSVTWVKAGPCVVTQIKKIAPDGYWAVQLGFKERKLKNTSKPLQGHLKSLIKDNKAPRHLREVRLDSEPEFKVGDVINLTDVFKKGDVVAVTGVSKGKGFAGVVKRWGFHGGPRTHGQSDRERAPGSIGQGTTPGRVYKGKKMAGRMGGEQVSVKNLTVLKVEENGDIWLSGPVPGFQSGLLQITKIGEDKKFVELYEKDTETEIKEG